MLEIVKSLQSEPIVKIFQSGSDVLVSTDSGKIFRVGPLKSAIVDVPVKATAKRGRPRGAKVNGLLHKGKIDVRHAPEQSEGANGLSVVSE